MNGHIETIIHLYMTPKDLRQIADEMEYAYENRLVGDSAKVKEWYVDNKTKVVFTIDQERIKK
jgi:hypothetical protein